jgi:hypothetical protein
MSLFCDVKTPIVFTYVYPILNRMLPEGIFYRGDNEDERRESAVMHTRMLDMINRLQTVGYPITDGDKEMFAYLEGFLIEIPDGYNQPAPTFASTPGPQGVSQPLPTDQPQTIPLPPQSPTNPPLPGQITDPTPSQQRPRGRLRPVQ